MTATHMPDGRVVTCHCGDEQMAFMFDLVDRGLSQWQASRIAFDGPAAADIDDVAVSPLVRKAWCGATVHRLFAQLRLRLGLPVADGAAS